MADISFYKTMPLSCLLLCIFLPYYVHLYKISELSSLRPLNYIRVNNNINPILHRSASNTKSKLLPIDDSMIIKNKQFFQDIFVEHLAPLKMLYGHVFETPEQWEQRFESNDLENKRFQGKVKWGTQDGNYGEHYWDLNHHRNK